MAETCKKDDVLNTLDALGEESTDMGSVIDKLLSQIEDMKEDVEDLAIDQSQCTRALSVVGELETKALECKTEMRALEGIGMASSLEAVAKTINDLETHSMEMFTRLMMLESMHIVPGLNSIREGQLSAWNRWQTAAAKVKDLIFNYIK